MDARSARERGRIIDRSDPQLSESKPSCTRLSSSRPGSFATLGCSARRCRRGGCSSVLTYTDFDLNLHKGHQNSTVRHGLHRKECSPCGQRGKAQRLSGMRHRIRTLPFISRYLSPSRQGPYFSNKSPLSCSYPLGYHRVYGRRAPRCHITRRGSDRYDPFRLNLLCSSGTYTRSTTRRISPLTFPAGIYVSTPWRLAHGAQRLRPCNTIVQAGTSPNATLWGPTAIGGLIGKLPNRSTATYRNRLPTLTDIRMEI
jgi:hypothetical protein